MAGKRIILVHDIYFRAARRKEENPDMLKSFHESLFVYIST